LCIDFNNIGQKTPKLSCVVEIGDKKGRFGVCKNWEFHFLQMNKQLFALIAFFRKNIFVHLHFYHIFANENSFICVLW
jgi:hypothetical protein